MISIKNLVKIFKSSGDSVRAVMLFEIWRPEISEDEKVALTAMFEAVTGYDAPSED